MSLLNQVLHDLQNRQAPDLENAQATLRTMQIPLPGSAPAAQRPWLLWLAIIVLACVSINLLWQRSQPSAPTTITGHAAPAVSAHPLVPARVAPSLPINPPATRAAAPARNNSVADHAPVVRPEQHPPQDLPASAVVRAPVTLAPPVAAGKDTPPPVTATAINKPMTANTAPLVTDRVTPRAPLVEKTARPLSREQQAELAYQDGLRLLQTGRPSAAEPHLRSALDADPAYHPARTALAGLLINSDRAAEATQLLAAGLNLAPRYAPFAKLYGRLRIDQGELAEARTVLERAAPPVQDDPDYHALLAALYQRLGLPAQAAASYRGALQVQPRNGVWWLGLGLALEGSGDPAMAVQAYERAQQSGMLDAEVLRYVETKLDALR